jgi:periplasmic protein TonB
VRLGSPFVLALAGTLVLHAIFIAGAHAVTVLFPPGRRAPTPRIELVEIEAPPVQKPPPPPVRQPEPPPEPPKEAPKPREVRAVQPDVSRPPPPSAEPPPQAEPEPQLDEPEPDFGGAPVVSMPDVAPAATGVPVASGPRNTGKVGRGGRGTGTGAGTGAGSSEAPPKPVSIATIKTPAAAKGDYDYTNDYPAEARRLGIEGVIRVRLVVDSLGKVKTAELMNRLGHGLDELALSRAKKLEFTPAIDTSDRPVESLVVWTFTMVLPKS